MPIENEYLENMESNTDFETTETNDINVITEPQAETQLEIENEMEKNEQINESIIETNMNENHLEKVEKSQPIEIDGIQEIEFNLDELDKADEIQIKKRNDVYYEMYREARRKAKIARDLALSSYLEVKRIKNTYMLDDIVDSDDSDLELDENDDDENDEDENLDEN
jgi:hypothetical protein